MNGLKPMATGRDLIIYILENNLENEPIFKNGNFIGFISDVEAAEKLGVGKQSIKTMASLGIFVNAYKMGDNFHVSYDEVKRLLRKGE